MAKIVDDETKIKREITRLNRIFAGVDDKKKKVVEGLISECAFMRVTLSNLKDNVLKNGVIDVMPQGEYSINRANPALNTYNVMVQKYTTAIEKLLGLLPKSAPVELGDGFDEFVGARDEV